MRSTQQIHIIFRTLFAVMAFVLIKITAIAQTCPTPQTRVYANTQQSNVGLLTSISNDNQAVDTNPLTASTLKRDLSVNVLGLTLGNITQFLNFSSTVPAGTAVTIKFSTSQGLLALLNSIVIQPYTNLQKPLLTWTATNAGVAFSQTTLVGAISSNGQVEVTITPKDSGGNPVAYDGVAISLGGSTILSASLIESVNIYGAYYMQNQAAGATMACSTPVDVLSGVRLGGLPLSTDIATITSSVTNPRNAIDGDPNTSADLSIALTQLQSEVYHTTVFGTPSQPGDMVKLILQQQSGGLIDLNLLNDFTVQLYNGAVPVGPPITSSSSGLLSLSLFSGSGSTEKDVLTVTPPASYGSFDRVEVSMGGLGNVSLGNVLKIFEVTRVMATPAVSIDAVVTNSGTVCAGSTSTLTVNNAQNCTTYTWYDAATGGNVKGTGASFTPDATTLDQVNPNNYYVEASRPGCTELSTRTRATITVNPRPSIVTATIPGVCGGDATTTLSYTTPVNSPTSYTITWDAAAHTAGFVDETDKGLPPSPLNVDIPPAAPAGTYNGTLTVKNANGCVSLVQPVSVTVIARPTQPTINPTPF